MNNSMQPLTRHAILASETQSREFDAKLLLASALAEGGLPTFVGSRIAMHSQIHRFPAATYIAKDFRKPSNRIFRIMRGLGHRIVAWDEEAVLFFSKKEFHERRVHPPTFAMVEELFAWGSENADYLSTAPGYDRRVPVFNFGNPRIDMLRPELRSFYDSDVADLRRRFGRIILINSNFGKLNHAVSKYIVKPGGKDHSVGGKITPFMEKAWSHRQRIFESFKLLLPQLAKAFPRHTIVLRPHPAENHQTWIDAASGLPNVLVLHEGTVHKWLLAAEVMIHNSCTTGIEGYLLDAPVIAYRPYKDETADLALANDLGLEVSSPEEMVQTIQLLSGKPRPAVPPSEKARTLGRYISGLDGPLATDLIAREILRFSKLPLPETTTKGRLRALADARLRQATKWAASFIPDHKNSRAYNQQRFPGISRQDAEARLQQLQRVLGRFEHVTIRPFSKDIFLVS